MFRTSSPNDGYSALENLLSKLNPHRATLFQYSKKNWEAADDHEVWYENHPLGKSKLATMMKEISEVSRIYRNTKYTSKPNAHMKFKSRTTNSKRSHKITNHAQQTPITHSDYKLLTLPGLPSHLRCKMSKNACHTLWDAILESSRHLAAFSSRSTNENHVLFSLLP